MYDLYANQVLERGGCKRSLERVFLLIDHVLHSTAQLLELTLSVSGPLRRFPRPPVLCTRLRSGAYLLLYTW